jgi:segregation and condensation protein B
MEKVEELKQILEGLLFSSSEPLSLHTLKAILEPICSLDTDTKIEKLILDAIGELQENYQKDQRAFQIEEIAKGYILRTRKELAPYIQALFKGRRSERLSQAALEVLAIIAYKQPITRPEIDTLRGVDSSGVIAALQERELIEGVGKLEVPGRPTLYGVTSHFLKHFGWKNLEELPVLKRHN